MRNSNFDVPLPCFVEIAEAIFRFADQMMQQCVRFSKHFIECWKCGWVSAQAVHLTSQILLANC